MNTEEQRIINLAKRCVNNGKYEYAHLLIAKLMEPEINRENAELLEEVAKLNAAMKNYQAALNVMKKSFDIEKSVEGLEFLASLNMNLQNYEDAAIQFEELTRFKDEEPFYIMSSRAYDGLELHEESIRVLKKAIEKFGSATAYSSLVFAYIVIGMEKESIESAEILKEKYPNSPITFNTLGFLYEAIYNDYETAKKYFLKSAKLGFIEAYYNLGVCCKQSEDFANAEKYLKKLISLKATTKLDYKYTLGSVYMAQRKLALGYKYYKNRKQAEQLNPQNKKRLWDGKDYPSKTLYVSSEQGFGDNIQFIRYIPLAAKKFKKLIYAATPNLVELFRQSFPVEKYPNIEIVSTEDVVRYHKYALIMDLPHLLHMSYHVVPAEKSYLNCSERAQKMNKQNLFEDNGKIKIGMCWRAKGMGIRDAVYRTIDAPYYFRNIMDFDNVDYYSFQMGDIFDMCKKYPQMKDITKNIKTFADTAAIMKNIDIFITVDTAIAHLAGALGIKTYLLLCHAPDWRWFDNDKKTEWYPSVTIIKQQDRRTWDDVAQKLEEYIKRDCGQK